MNNTSSLVDFIHNCKSFLVFICRYTAKFIRALVHYTWKGWWVVLLCMVAGSALSLYKYFTTDYPKWRVKGEVRFNGFNRITFQQELSNISFPAEARALEIIAGEVADTYADSVPDFYNWNGQITINDRDHHVMPDRTYLCYSTWSEDPFAPFAAMQQYFASKPYYQTLFEVQRRNLQEQSSLLHAKAAEADALEVIEVYHTLSYVDEKLAHCTQPLVMVGDAEYLPVTKPSLARAMRWPFIGGWLIGWLITLLFMKRKEVFGK